MLQEKLPEIGWEIVTPRYKRVYEYISLIF